MTAPGLSVELTPAKRWTRPRAVAGGLIPPVLRLVAPILVYSAVAWWMFRGGQLFGMEFDEVFRVNNLVAVQHGGALPYNQAISSIEIFGLSVPLMYKSYISSAYLVSFLPLGLFPDPLVGIRTLYVVSTVLAASTGYLLFRSRSYWLAAGIPLLALVSPLLYPEIVYGFVDVQYLIPLLVATWFFRAYIRRRRMRELFAAGLFAAIALNISFYTAWLLAGVAVALVVLYWDVAWSILASARRLGVLVLAGVIGCFNYVYYNFTAGFPSLRPLLNRFFFPDAYEANPIDFKKTNGVFGDAALRLPKVWEFLGPAAWFVVPALAAALLVMVISIIRRRFEQTWRHDRLLYTPMVVLLVAFAAIIVSPNTTRRGHYGVLVGLVEATLAAGFLLGFRLLAPRARPAIFRRIAIAAFAIYFALTASVSRTSVERQLESGGVGYFSSAIFDLYNYVATGEGDPLLQVQWGSYAQFYFLSDGKYESHNVVFSVLGASSDDARVQIVTEATRAAGGAVLVPVYTKVSRVNGVDPIELLMEVAQGQDGSLCTVAVFGDRLGHEQIRLFRLEVDAGGRVSPDAICASG